MNIKEFLEDYSLYKKAEIVLEDLSLVPASQVEHVKIMGIDLTDDLNQLNLPVINFRCKSCSSNQSYEVIHRYGEDYDLKASGKQITRIKGRSFWVIYQCVACKDQRYEFLLNMADDGSWIQKIGQWPSWKAEISPDLRRTLSRLGAMPLYIKGVTSESQGYGIGADAYYRRIVEKVIQKLLDDITEIVDESQSIEFKQAVEEAKKQKHASEKIRLVKDILPSMLRPGGMNPLGVLYGALSDGVHTLSDDECLERAQQIRTVLDFLVKQIEQSKEQRKAYVESMTKLKTKKVSH